MEHAAQVRLSKQGGRGALLSTLLGSILGSTLYLHLARNMHATLFDLYHAINVILPQDGSR